MFLQRPFEGWTASLAVYVDQLLQFLPSEKDTISLRFLLSCHQWKRLIIKHPGRNRRRGILLGKTRIHFYFQGLLSQCWNIDIKIWVSFLRKQGLWRKRRSHPILPSSLSYTSVDWGVDKNNHNGIKIVIVILMDQLLRYNVCFSGNLHSLMSNIIELPSHLQVHTGINKTLSMGSRHPGNERQALEGLNLVAWLWKPLFNTFDCS